MAMVVKNNMAAKNTLNQLDRNDKALAKSLQKVASGMKINSAADDASGYAISEKMDVQIRSLDQDEVNGQTATSLMKVAEGSVSSTVDILRTLKEKAIQAANDTNTDEDRATIQKELDQAIDQIDDNASVTYNDRTLMDGSNNSIVLDPGTHTSLTNQSLGTETDPYTLMTDLTRRDGGGLGIRVGDTVTVSYVKDGITNSHDITVADDTEIQMMFDWSPCNMDLDIYDPLYKDEVGTNQYGETVHTSDNKNAVTYHAKNPGLDGQISGLTVVVKDSGGSVNKTATEALNDFKESVRAQNPSPDNALTFQFGTRANQSLKVGLTDMRSVALGLKSSTGQTLQLRTQTQANAAVNVLENAITKVLNQQTSIGAVSSRIEYTSENITTASDNTTGAKSVITDADMAKEMTEYTKNNVLSQAAQAMLAQANQNSSQVLSLLQ